MPIQFLGTLPRTVPNPAAEKAGAGVGQALGAFAGEALMGEQIRAKQLETLAKQELLKNFSTMPLSLRGGMEARVKEKFPDLHKNILTMHGAGAFTEEFLSTDVQAQQRKLDIAQGNADAAAAKTALGGWPSLEVKQGVEIAFDGLDPKQKWAVLKTMPSGPKMSLFAGNPEIDTSADSGTLTAADRAAIDREITKHDLDTSTGLVNLDTALLSMFKGEPKKYGQALKEYVALNVPTAMEKAEAESITDEAVEAKEKKKAIVDFFDAAGKGQLTSDVIQKKFLGTSTDAGRIKAYYDVKSAMGKIPTEVKKELTAELVTPYKKELAAKKNKISTGMMSDLAEDAAWADYSKSPGGKKFLSENAEMIAKGELKRDMRTFLVNQIIQHHIFKNAKEEIKTGKLRNSFPVTLDDLAEIKSKMKSSKDRIGGTRYHFNERFKRSDIEAKLNDVKMWYLREETIVNGKIVIINRPFTLEAGKYTELYNKALDDAFNILGDKITQFGIN